MDQAATQLIDTAANLGIEVCFANPGTTEMPIVRALDKVSVCELSLACTKMSAQELRTAMAGLPKTRH